MSKPLSRAETLAARQERARIKLLSMPEFGAQVLPVITGITPNGIALWSYESRMAEITKIMTDSGQFFTFAGQIVVQEGEGETGELVILAGPNTVEPVACSLLPNFLVCEATHKSKEGDVVVQFGLPPKIVAALLHRYATRRGLPQLKSYFRRPVHDEDFNLRGPGWHEDIQVLVHGICVEPADLGAVPATWMPILERLSPHLRRLLGDFCVKSDADLAAMVGAIITGVLANHFVESGKPIFLLDGNQPGLGKTLFALIVGVLMDGSIPEVNGYVTNQEELEKQIGATVRTVTQSLLIFDNAKLPAGDVINSPKLEASCVSPWISGRILGRSENYRRRNDLMWFLTMNDTKVSRDLNHRGVPIQLYLEGDPATRSYGGRDALDYALTYRREILAEIFGMIERYKAAGRPPGTCHHRLTKWADEVGGIMVANGLPEFLTNLERATAEFDTEADKLIAIAEEVLRVEGGPVVIVDDNTEVDQGKAQMVALSAGDWVRILRAIGIEKEKLEIAKSNRSKGTVAGNLLSPLVGQQVELDLKGCPVRAVLRSINGRSNRKHYYLEVHRDGQCRPEDQPKIIAKPKPKLRFKPKIKLKLKQKLENQIKPGTPPPLAADDGEHL